MSRKRDDSRGPRWPREFTRDRDKGGDRDMPRDEAPARHADVYRPSNYPSRRDANGASPVLSRRSSLTSASSATHGPAKEAPTSGSEIINEASVPDLLSKRSLSWRNKLYAAEHCEKLAKQISILKEKRPQGPETHFDTVTLQKKLIQTTNDSQLYGKEIAKLDKLLQAQFTDKLVKVDQMDQRFAGLESHQKAQQEGIASLEKQLNDLREAQGTEQEGGTKGLESAMQRMEQIITENNDLKSQFNVLERRLEESNKSISRISALEQKIEENSTLASRIVDLEKKLEEASSLAPRILDLEKKLEDAEGLAIRIVDIEKRLEDISGLTARMLDMENKLEEVSSHKLTVRTQDIESKAFNPDRMIVEASQNPSRSSSPAHTLPWEHIRQMVESHEKKLAEMHVRGPVFSPAPTRDDSQVVAKVEVFTSLYKELMHDVGAHKHRIERLEADTRHKPEQHQSPNVLGSARPPSEADIATSVKTQLHDWLDRPGGALDTQDKRLVQVEARLDDLLHSKADTSSLQTDFANLKCRFHESEESSNGKYQELSIQVESIQEWQNNFNMTTFKREVANDVKALLVDQPHSHAGALPYDQSFTSEGQFAHNPQNSDILSAKRRKIRNGQAMAVNNNTQQPLPSNGTLLPPRPGG